MLKRVKTFRGLEIDRSVSADADSDFLPYNGQAAAGSTKLGSFHLEDKTIRIYSYAGRKYSNYTCSFLLKEWRKRERSDRCRLFHASLFLRLSKKINYFTINEND